ncbi:MAG: 50S ribosomal protein L2 [Candidatus Micrarchaeota archaeon]
MGTIIISQKRGKGGPIYRTPKHRFTSDAKYPTFISQRMRGEVLDFLLDPSKDTPLAKVLLENGLEVYLLAAEGLRVGQILQFGKDADIAAGCVTTLEKVPDSVMVFNIELQPNDGGKFARTSGAFGTIISHDKDTGDVEVKLASKRVIILDKDCRATLGIAAGGGRTEKPLKKAGTAHYKWHSRNKHWPIVRGTAMSAYDHPHGGKSFGKPTMRKRGTPPGKYVGHRAAKRVGRKQGKLQVERSGKKKKG